MRIEQLQRLERNGAPRTTRPGTSRRERAHEQPPRERTRGERGQVVVLAALMIPVFLLLGALVVDAGNWYAHKRSLQNRADAGALAAGLEYIKNNNLRNCVSAPGTTGTTISNVAKAYAGTSDTSVGTTYNKNVNNQSNVTVAVNATNPTALDWTDGGSPCADHSADGWSSARALDRREGPRGEHRDALRLVRHQPAADRRAGARQGRADHRRRRERPAVHRRDRRPDRVRLGAVRARAGRLDEPGSR